MTSLFRPLLAGKADLAILSFPLLASYKLDGLRCLAMNGVAMSRSMKPLPNRYVQWLFTEHHNVLNGIDGEIIVGEPNAKDVYRTTSSAIMSQDGKPSFTFFAFDYWAYDNYIFSQRLHSITNHNLPPFAQILPHKQINSLAELEAFEIAALADGYEGVMLRDPRGRYKQGRSSTKEGILLKLKRHEDAEAVLTGIEERMHNDNIAQTNELGRTKRSTHAGNLVPTNSMGALVVRGLTAFEGLEFRIGTGFTEAQRQSYWARRKELIGRTVKFSYFPVGVKELPRHPVFIGWRNVLDLDAKPPIVEAAE